MICNEPQAGTNSLTYSDIGVNKIYIIVFYKVIEIVSKRKYQLEDLLDIPTNSSCGCCLSKINCFALFDLLGGLRHECIELLSSDFVVCIFF
jgi:hypothetical protein